MPGRGGVGAAAPQPERRLGCFFVGTLVVPIVGFFAELSSGMFAEVAFDPFPGLGAYAAVKKAGREDAMLRPVPCLNAARGVVAVPDLGAPTG